MKLIILSIALIATCASAASLFDRKLDSHWDNFKQTHSKLYANTEEELQKRQVWEKNLKYVNSHNEEFEQGKHTYTLAMNRFGDMTKSEFTSAMNGYNKTKNLVKSRGSLFLIPSNVQIPASVDWRTEGYVTPVKDQGSCGSCWSFSAAAALEGQHFKQSGKLVSLSEQNLVDCSRKYGNDGCNGGLMDQAFTYIKENKGIDTEESYPYKAKDGKCAFKAANVGATDSGFTDIPAGNEKALTAALATVGPISVAIDASHDSFQFYSSGVYTEADCSSTQLDHGVTAVGYGTESGQDFYIVKNSWAATWGDEGYIKMARNKNNMCGIASSASYPLV